MQQGQFLLLGQALLYQAWIFQATIELTAKQQKQYNALKFRFTPMESARDEAPDATTEARNNDDTVSAISVMDIMDI